MVFKKRLARRILICGDRHWTNRKKIRLAIKKEMKKIEKENTRKISTLNKFSWQIVVIQGEAKGADIIAKQEAMKLGLLVIGVEANWEFYDKAAGPIRNKWMLDFCNPDLVIAFHSNISQSKGTANMVKIAKKAGVEVRVIK